VIADSLSWVHSKSDDNMETVRRVLAHRDQHDRPQRGANRPVAPDRDGPHRLGVVKSNLARYPEPGGVVPRYHPEAPTPYRRPTDVDECAAWLVDMLRERSTPMRPHVLIELCPLRLQRTHGLAGE
jgi:hypothetical protein